MRIRDLDPSSDADACDAIVAGLPDWFGHEQGIADCAAAVRSQDGLVAEDAGLVGFLTWEPVDDAVAEITWMAVRADRRRSGVGGALLAEVVARLRAAGFRELRVRTLSDREPSPALRRDPRLLPRQRVRARRRTRRVGPGEPCPPVGAAALSRGRDPTRCARHVTQRS